MARKLCPACGTLKGGSAKTCDCGHVFDEKSIVVPAAPKICPHCGAGNAQSAHTCHCGRHFDLDEKATRAVIVRRRNRGLSLVVVGAALIATELVVALTVGISSFWLFLGTGLVMSAGVRDLLLGSRDLQIHDETHPQLPKATAKLLEP